MNHSYFPARLWHQISQIRLVSLALLGIMGLSGSIILAWFSGQESINHFFQSLNYWQEHPPAWIEAPILRNRAFLVWEFLLWFLIWIVMRISPRPTRASRVLMVGVLGVLTIRYLLWRSLSSLNLSTPLEGVFSLGLFLLELIMILGHIIQLFLLLRVYDRRSQADQLSIAVINRSFTPTVDIFIPTYNEPDFVLRRTIIGCQAIDYPHKIIYILDDTQRPEIQSLAAELGCEYRTRPNRLHAKAGNLNHALGQTQGELIVVFDADFVPTTNFLTRTVGFFQNSKIALVQTPQNFYNPDPIAHNLGLDHILTSEEELFYRQIQPMRDAADSVICSGTSFVMRRSALLEIGGFFTESLTEDFFTGIKLSAQGYRLIYLNEKLSAGLAAESIGGQALQRIRWAQGTLQSFFVSANPLTIRGLNPLQRLSYSEGLLHWFTSLSRVGFLLMPLAYAGLGVSPVRATNGDIWIYFIPYYLVNLTVFSWFNDRSRSALFSDVYSLVLCFPLAWTVIQSMIFPFAQGFKVTPKGISSHRFSFSLSLSIPLFFVFITTLLSLWSCLSLNSTIEIRLLTLPAIILEKIKACDLGLLWSFYNLIIVSIALLVLIDVPRPNRYPSFDLQRSVKVTLNHKATLNHKDQDGDEIQSQTRGENDSPIFLGQTIVISEIGAEVLLTPLKGIPLKETSLKKTSLKETNVHHHEYHPIDRNLFLELEFLELDLKLQGYSIETIVQPNGIRLCLQFDAMTQTQHRRLVEMLYCRPGQWPSRCAPGEIRSLWLLFRIFLKPRIIFDRSVHPPIVHLTQDSANDLKTGLSS